MANNRMWLVCRGCGTGILIGKIMSSGYYTSVDSFEDNLNEFYDTHAFCGNVNPENMFEMQYESACDDGVKECDYNTMKLYKPKEAHQ